MSSKFAGMRAAVERMSHVVGRMEDSRLRIELSRSATTRVERIARAHGLDDHNAADLVILGLACTRSSGTSSAEFGRWSHEH